MPDEPLLSENTWVKTSLAKFGAGAVFLCVTTYLICGFINSGTSAVRDVANNQKALEERVLSGQRAIIESLSMQGKHTEEQFTLASDQRKLLASRLEVENWTLRLKIRNNQLDVPPFSKENEH